ncbi:hypothetical protein BJ742DRAFT_846733 [Cladochytrium replicatum]|nr:hypothetical protein BJ742DRAFT_846733 [Cladochytrium replicatum]
MMLLNEYCQKYKLTKTIVTERPGPGVYVIALQVGEQVYRSTPQVRKQDAKVEAAKVAMEALVPGSLDKDDGEEKDAKKGSGSQSGGFSGAGRGQLVRPHYGYQQQQQQQQQQPQYFGPQGFGGFPFGGMGMMSGYMGGHQQNVFGTMAGQGFAFGAGTAAGTGPATPQVPIRFPFRGQFPAAGRPSGPPF